MVLCHLDRRKEEALECGVAGFKKRVQDCIQVGRTLYPAILSLIWALENFTTV